MIEALEARVKLIRASGVVGLLLDGVTEALADIVAATASVEIANVMGAHDLSRVELDFGDHRFMVFARSQPSSQPSRQDSSKAALARSQSKGPPIARPFMIPIMKQAAPFFRRHDFS